MKSFPEPREKISSSFSSLHCNTSQNKSDIGIHCTVIFQRATSNNISESAGGKKKKKCLIGISIEKDCSSRFK